MARWTLTSLIHIPTATSLRVGATTNKEDHLWMSWSYTRPGRTPIYRTVRGKMIFCGYKYVWDTPAVEEQTAAGDTLGHIFYLTNLVSESRIWYYLHAPNPPSEWETQGGLQFVDLIHAAPPGSYLYFASKLKGMFMTTTFSDIGEDQPVWVPDNVGLPWLDISQAVLDPFIPDHYRYVICHGHLYRMYNAEDFGPANSITILTQPEALALTGCAAGKIVWVQPNARHSGMLHVLWSGTPAPCSYWHLLTLDYGDHWTAHLIIAATGSESAGNIMPGFNKGTSPYAEGDVVYAAINLGLFDTPTLARSLDQGATWTTMDAGDVAHGIFRPRIHVDPADQSVVYIGCDPAFHKLYRSQDHGDTWDRVDQGEAISPSLDSPGYYQAIRTHPANPNLVRVFRRFHVYTSHDYCASWQNVVNLAEPCAEGRFTNPNPNLLYLAKVVSGTPPPYDHGASVLFISADDGLSLYPKAGAHAYLADGGGDSIPYNCGGVANDGILIVPSP